MRLRLAALAMSTFSGPRQQWIEGRLRAELAPIKLSIINESHGAQEDESHFLVVIVSEAFEGKKHLQRHRMVNAALTDNGALPFHSLRITAKTPTESVDVPPAPKCAGGDGRG